MFINGVGAIAGPLIVGWMMDVMGNNGYWMFSAVLMFLMGLYAAYRMTRRSRADWDDIDTVPYAAVSATSTPIAAEVAQEVYSDAEEEISENDTAF